MAGSYVSEADRVLGSGGTNYNAVFTDKTDNSILEASDFMNLLIVQLQNQDFTDPMDNSQMVNQMATFSNMQSIQEMASYSKTLYAMNLVGKTVTASRNTVSGDLDTITGMVEKVSLLDGEYILYVGGKKYTLSQIMSIGAASGTLDNSGTVSDGFALKATESGRDYVSLKWDVPTEDEFTASKYKFEVYYSDSTPFGTVEQVEAGTKFTVPSGATEAEITGLSSNKRYYFNVVVTDDRGRKSVFKPVAATTKI